MTNSWFLCTARYTKQLEDGQLKRVNEPFLVDAVSFTDAEARMYEELGSRIRGEFLIVGEKKVDYADVFEYEDSEQWYEAKLQYESVDADSGKQKKVTNKFLVTAVNIGQAYKRINESLSDMMVSFTITQLKESKIVEIFPYDGEREVIDDSKEDDLSENPEGVFSSPSEEKE